MSQAEEAITRLLTTEDDATAVLYFYFYDRPKDRVSESSCDEARVVPDSLELLVHDCDGRYYGSLDRHWIFCFWYEEDAVRFMNTVDVDVDVKAGHDIPMKVIGDRKHYLVYIPDDKYNPPLAVN